MPFSVCGPRLISSPVVLTVFQRMGREGGGYGDGGKSYLICASLEGLVHAHISVNKSLKISVNMSVQHAQQYRILCAWLGIFMRAHISVNISVKRSVKRSVVHKELIKEPVRKLCGEMLPLKHH